MEPLAELPLVLPPRGSGTRLREIHGQLRAAILDGRLQTGLRLPSSREFAAAYCVARNTVVAAYDLLAAEGYVVTRRGSGTVVAAALAKPRGAARQPLPRRRLLNQRWCGVSAGRGVRGAALVERAPRYWFRLGVPDVAHFPFTLWNGLMRRVQRWHAASDGVPDAQGLPALREAIAMHVSLTRAVACTAADIVVTAGAAQAFDLLARILTTERSRVVVENPGYPPVRAAFAAHGAQIHHVPVDAEGLVVSRLPERCRVVCVTPSHQFPLGAVLSPARRLALLDYCRRRDAVVIEDDYDAEFRFAERPLEALQTLDRGQCVFYVGTFSKSLMPELRVGYIVAPPWALAALVAAKRLADGHGNSLTQGAIALMIREGHMARHVRKMGRLYETRRALLLERLQADFAPWLTPLPAVAGLHIAARFTGACDEDALLARALAAEVRVGSLRPYFVGKPGLQGLVFGYGGIDAVSIREGLERLRRVLVSQEWQ